MYDEMSDEFEVISNNQWPVYSYMKRSWRKDGKFKSFADVQAEFPNTSSWALSEGMIEFQLAYERSFKHEVDFIPDDELTKLLNELLDDMA